MAFEDIRYESHEGIGVITLNRPEKLNAFRAQTLAEMAEALSRAARDRAVGVIVLAGAGGKAFSVGGDIAEMKAMNRKTGQAFVQRLQKLSALFLGCPQPIVAKVNGYCVGGGNEIQLFCDLTIASEKSVFGQVGPRVGSVPLWGGTQILPLLVGLKKAKEMVYLCRQYPATEAQKMGLINEVVPEPQLDARVDQVCRELLQKSPQSLRLARSGFHGRLSLQVRQDLKRLGPIYGSAELTEGMAAFLEKRDPDFSKFRK